MSPPVLHTQDTNAREIETIVLTQLRDSMALVNANMTKLSDKLDGVKDTVTELASAKYDQQIVRLEDQYKEDMRRVEDNLQRQVTTNAALLTKHEDRLVAQSVQLGRLGMGMAIAGAVGGTALGITVTTLMTKLMGAG